MHRNKFQYDIGIIHGRFQILHNDHVKYLMAGKDLCEHIIVGITNPDPSLTKDHESNPHRSTELNNPLTYYERMLMVKETLLEQSLKLSEFSIVPFPINYPHLLKYYVPLDKVFFLSIYDNWGRQKKRYLENLGLNVHVLWEVTLEEKGLSGQTIRKKMINDQPWKQFVPKSVQKLIIEWNIIERLKNLYSLS
jgi:nicotinamide-nucleotide adenylyltransferase